MTVCSLCREVREVEDQSRPQVGLLCFSHYLDLVEVLSDIERLYEAVSDADFLASTREARSDFGKTLPPLNLHVASLLDRRTKMMRKGDPVSAERVLRAWVYAVYEECYGSNLRHAPLPREGGIPWLVRDLTLYLSWLVEREQVVRFARHMACVRDGLRRVIPGEKTGDRDDG